MGTRVQLQTMLETLLGSSNVYYQPPSTVRMKYPAIVYERANIQHRFADNRPYKTNISYKITVIDRDPDSNIVTKVSELPLCSFNTHFVADNLNHDVFTLYY